MACNCGNKSWQKKDVSGINISEVSIKRYEKALFTIDKRNIKKGLLQIAGDYQIFLKGDLNDTLNLIQLSGYINDPLLTGIYNETQKKYPDLKDTEGQMTLAFKYYSFYFPGNPLPHVYTFISGLDYQIPVIFVDTALLIAIDMYMGPEYEPYKELGLPSYMTARFDKKYLVRDCMDEMITAMMQNTSSGNSMLDRMIYEGKHMVMLDALLPEVPEEIKIKYSPEQVEWCKKNEANLWKFLIENQLLYSIDIGVINKFFLDGPFTHGFEGSPSRLGTWLGWQIVTAYMKRQNDVNFTKLIEETDSQKILTQSKYKPKR
jgi:hypothetical protein